MGLMAKKSGLHVAFVGGTGILAVLDLVTRLILTNLGQLSEDQCLADDFQLHLFATFRNEGAYIGVDLCNKLLEVNRKLGKTNFKFVLRTASDDPKSFRELKMDKQDRAIVTEERRGVGQVKPEPMSENQPVRWEVVNEEENSVEALNSQPRDEKEERPDIQF